MKILLTGGAGFIGSHVAAAFLAAGHQVVVVDDLSTGDRSRVPPGASFHLADVASPELDAIFARERPDVVDHHAAQISVTASARDPLADARANALGTLNVLECCRRHQVRKVIFISSGGAIYGDAPVDRIPETRPPAPLSPYAIHKLTGEHYLRFYRAQHGLAYTSLRYANVYGPGQNPDGEAGVVAIFCTKLLRGEVPVLNAWPDDPEGMARDYVYVEDVAEANALSLVKGDDGIFNIGTGTAVKTRELLETIAHLLGSEPRYTPAGPRPGDLRRSCLDNRRALEVLGWRPTHDLAAGLAKTVAWFQSHA
ncbi:MAG: NAD-dependent epimerase/dehydratase family protein [Spirochaetes bacterium]|nr:NAD-dependent epimerase/dehydratase family protein [Spirochaetota bacterium]